MNYEWTIDLILVLFLGVVSYQDFKHKAISWVLIPILFILQSVLAVRAVKIESAAFFFLVNFGFISLQLVCLTIYFSIKNRKFTNIVNSYLGIGDILFFFVLCPAFSPINFILFYLGSLILILIGFIFYTSLKKEANKEIPLAGAMALGLIVCYGYKYLNEGCNFYRDIIQL